MDFLKLSLKIAEGMDAFRVVPRTILVAYAWFVYKISIWFINIPMYVQEQCDPAVLEIFLKAKYTILQAQELACHVVGTNGGGSGTQAAFVSTIVGLAGIITGLYFNSGRKWQNETQQPIIIQNPPVIPPGEPIIPEVVGQEPVVVVTAKQSDNGPPAP